MLISSFVLCLVNCKTDGEQKQLTEEEVNAMLREIITNGNWKKYKIKRVAIKSKNQFKPCVNE